MNTYKLGFDLGILNGWRETPDPGPCPDDDTWQPHLLSYLAGYHAGRTAYRAFAALARGFT